MADRVDPDQELRDALARLRLAVVRRLCERLEDPKESATPSYLEAARKLLEGQGVTLGQKTAARPRPVTEGLPIFEEE